MSLKNDPSIALASFFNSANLGDLLIGDTIHHLCSPYGEVTKIGYGGPRQIKKTPEAQLEEWWQKLETGQAQEQVYRKNLRNSIFRVVRNSPFREIFSTWRRLTDPGHKWVKSSLEEADLFVFGGGNLLYDLSAGSRSELEFKYFADLAKRRGIPVVAVGIGIGPFVLPRQAQRAVDQLKRCDYITFRDQASHQIYLDYGGLDNAVVTLDPVFNFPKVITDYKSEEKHTIAVNLVCPDVSNTHLDRESCLSLFSRILEEFPDVTLEVFSTDLRDYPFLISLVDELGNSRCVIYKITSLDSYLDLLSRSKCVIGSRMHALILSFTQQVPFLSFVWQPKVREFTSIVDCENTSFSIETLQHDLARIINAIALVTSDEKAKEHLASQMEDLQVRLQTDKDRLAKSSRSFHGNAG